MFTSFITSKDRDGSRSDRHARLLASQLAALGQPNGPEAGGTAALIEAMVDVAAEAAGRAADANGDVGQAERHLLLAMIKRHIGAHLDAGPLTADDLCRRFRISRAGLYRLFGPDGGLARYVQEQRLNRALRLLASPASRGKRLIDLAVDFRFSSDSTFVRAFRRQFGRTPGEIRELAEAWRRETDASPAPHDLFHNLARS